MGTIHKLSGSITVKDFENLSKIGFLSRVPITYYAKPSRSESCKFASGEALLLSYLTNPKFNALPVYSN